jgi:hypothetical protein
MNLDTENKLNISAKDLAGKMIAVLGITGSGKTNTAAVLIEELLDTHIPLAVVDIEGEFWGLKEKFEILIAGKSENVDIEVQPEQAAQVARLSIEKEIPVILDLSGFKKSEMFTFLFNFLEALWEANKDQRKPYAIFIEEAHEFIPQSQAANPALKELITQFALRGRKRGFRVVVMSQRSAKVAKDVLTQASLLFLHQVVHPTDISVYKDLIPLPASQVEETVRALEPGQAIVLYRNQAQVASIRLRHTLHVGATPEQAGATTFEPKRIDASLLEEFEKLAAPPAEEGKVRGQPSERKLIERVKELEKLLAESQSEIRRLTEQLALVGTLKRHEPVPILPANLKLERMEVNKLVTAEQAKAGGMAIAAAVKEPEVKVATGLRKELNPVEQDRLNRVLRKVTALSTLEANIFKVLIESGAKMLRQDLAAWTGYSFTSIQHQRLLSLIRTGLVDYYNPGYKSNVLNFARTAFPGVAPEVIISQIRSALSPAAR